ncbi:hypothetical protein [Pseudomonas sp. Irchel s3a18]|uniref:hypothetical protein n=1 Tax=Pseudomonas sp. Irchel s3a18 TaxID=2009053 RepID=UPI000BA464C0|nr:hypothetical protein [Pseudomonas sp. Irchel s3a18]
MVEFERPFYADAGSRVMVGGKSAEQIEADLASGLARVGGFWRSPNYFESYLQAAQMLIDQGQSAGCLDDIGLPAFYLQRHAAELLLKSVLGWILDIQDFRNQLKDLAYKTDIEQRSAELFGHDLPTLLSRVQSRVKDLDLPPPPPELDALIRKLDALEPTDTWARYSTSRKGKKGSPTIAHQKEESVIPLVELQAGLVCVADLIASRELCDSSYEDELYSEWNRLDHILEALVND